MSDLDISDVPPNHSIFALSISLSPLTVTLALGLIALIAYVTVVIMHLPQ